MMMAKFYPLIMAYFYTINRVGKALKEKSESDAISSTFPFSIPSVHVSYKAFQVNRIVNEESLRALYSQYGEVLDVTIKHATVDQV